MEFADVKKFWWQKSHITIAVGVAIIAGKLGPKMPANWLGPAVQ